MLSSVDSKDMFCVGSAWLSGYTVRFSFITVPSPWHVDLFRTFCGSLQLRTTLICSNPINESRLNTLSILFVCLFSIAPGANHVIDMHTCVSNPLHCVNNTIIYLLQTTHPGTLRCISRLSLSISHVKSHVSWIRKKACGKLIVTFNAEIIVFC